MDETRKLIEAYFDLSLGSVDRAGALNKLQMIADSSIGLELLERAKEFNDYDKTTVVFSLRACGNEECSDVLVEWLAESKDTELTTAICEVLGYIGKVDTIPVLLKLIDDFRADVVFWASNGLEMLLERYFREKVRKRGAELFA